MSALWLSVLSFSPSHLLFFCFLSQQRRTHAVMQPTVTVWRRADPLFQPQRVADVAEMGASCSPRLAPAPLKPSSFCRKTVFRSLSLCSCINHPAVIVQSDLRSALGRRQTSPCDCATCLSAFVMQLRENDLASSIQTGLLSRCGLCEGFFVFLRGWKVVEAATRWRSS